MPNQLVTREENLFVITLSFLAFMLLFVGVGIYSATRKKDTTTDYLLASRDVNPWLTFTQ